LCQLCSQCNNIYIYIFILISKFIYDFYRGMNRKIIRLFLFFTGDENVRLKIDLNVKKEFTLTTFLRFDTRELRVETM
jgi:hypothetical protein